MTMTISTSGSSGENVLAGLFQMAASEYAQDFWLLLVTNFIQLTFTWETEGNWLTFPYVQPRKMVQMNLFAG